MMRSLAHLFWLSMLLMAGARGAQASEGDRSHHVEPKAAPLPKTGLMPRIENFLVEESMRWVEQPLVRRMALGGTDAKRMPEVYVFSRLHWKLGGDAQLGVGVPARLPGSRGSYAVLVAYTKKF